MLDCIGSLEVRQQEVILLQYNGMNDAEIAAETSYSSAGTVAMTRFRAMDKVRQCLQNKNLWNR